VKQADETASGVDRRRFLYAPRRVPTGHASGRYRTILARHPEHGGRSLAAGIVTAEKLARSLTGDEAPCVVDARPRATFRQGHIPGAVSMQWEEWCQTPPPGADAVLSQPGYWGVLQDSSTTDLARRLSSLGLHEDQPIVVYADGPASKGRDGRVAWMLLYFGARQVALLDGGWRAWLASGGSVEAEEGEPVPGRFRVRFQEERRRTQAGVRQDLDSGAPPALVDTRSREEIARERHPYLARDGVLPAAYHVPFETLFTPDGRFVGQTLYRERLPRELTVASEIVAYCEVGVRAASFAVLHEAYTGTVIAVFDGSHNEWALHEDLPLAPPARPWLDRT
jgi:thiosulfate/3-mercaptopyruvate sulfurtransferase